MGMSIGEQPEERHLEPVLLRGSVTDLQEREDAAFVRTRATTYQRRKLEVISYQDKLLCEPKGAETRRQSDLGRFVDDAVVKLSPRK